MKFLLEIVAACYINNVGLSQFYEQILFFCNDIKSGKDLDRGLTVKAQPRQFIQMLNGEFELYAQKSSLLLGLIMFTYTKVSKQKLVKAFFT